MWWFRYYYPILFSRHENQNPHFVIFFLHEVKCILFWKVTQKYNAQLNDVSKELIDSM